MKPQAFVLSPEARPSALDVLGTRITVLASNAATRAYEITHQCGQAGSGAPPHRHPWDESFYVLDGTVEFTAEGQTRLCVPGTLVHVPADTVHSFRYGADGGGMIEISGQGGHATQLFGALSRTLAAGRAEPSDLTEVLADYGATLAI
jgi:quercetin dioxygenase-like cupin family protein